MNNLGIHFNEKGFRETLFYKKGSINSDYAIFDSRTQTNSNTLSIIEKIGSTESAEWENPVASLAVALARSNLDYERLAFFLSFWQTTDKLVRHSNLSVWHSIMMVIPPHAVVGPHTHGSITRSTISFCRTLSSPETAGVLTISGKAIKCPNNSIAVMNNNETHGFVNGPNWTFFSVFFLSELAQPLIYNKITDFTTVYQGPV